MNLDELQTDVGLWGMKTFGPGRPEAILAHLADELVELCIYREPEEAADCLILLLQFAHVSGFSLYDETAKKMDINRRRRWGAPDERGVVRHVEEESVG